MSTIREVVQSFAAEGSDIEPIVAALVAREDEVADQLRAAGAQFGLFPQIVAEVIAHVGLGSTPSETERQMIRDGFVSLMETIRRQQEGS